MLQKQSCDFFALYIQPDIAAPGVNILAAAPPSKNQAEDALSYNMHSGTSTACSQVAGVAAILKAQNKKWSPPEKMSALMTTGVFCYTLIKIIDQIPNNLNFGCLLV